MHWFIWRLRAARALLKRSPRQSWEGPLEHILWAWGYAAALRDHYFLEDVEPVDAVDEDSSYWEA